MHGGVAASFGGPSGRYIASLVEERSRCRVGRPGARLVAVFAIEETALACWIWLTVVRHEMRRLKLGGVAGVVGGPSGCSIGGGGERMLFRFGRLVAGDRTAESATHVGFA